MYMRYCQCQMEMPLTKEMPGKCWSTHRAADREGVTSMSTTNGTTARTVRTIIAQSGMVLPATITPQTEFNTITTAVSVYCRQSGCLGSIDTAYLVADAMRDGSAVVVLYVGLDGGQDARVLWP